MLRILFSVFFLCSITCRAQTSAPAVSADDTLKLYHKLEKLSEKKGIYRFFYKKIFRIPQTYTATAEECPEEPCDIYRNCIIRNIQVVTLEPVGYSVYYTTLHQHSLVQKAGNFLHQRSTKLTVKNQLLIKKNTPL